MNLKSKLNLNSKFTKDSDRFRRNIVAAGFLPLVLRYGDVVAVVRAAVFPRQGKTFYFLSRYRYSRFSKRSIALFVDKLQV